MLRDKQHDPISQLRRAVTSFSPRRCETACNPIILGDDAMDAALSTSLFRGGLHEIYARGSNHVGAATGFAVTLAMLAAKGRPIVWVRQDVAALETGHINASGLVELGVDPGKVILVHARDCEGVLRAAEQSARCQGVGAVLIEPWGSPKILNLTASRRLSLACAQSGVSAVMLRVAASPSPSSAATRWRVQALPSRPLEANTPGFATFEVQLIRGRGGVDGLTWCVEWDRDRQRFQQQQRTERAPISRDVVRFSPDRSIKAGAQIQHLRRTG
jgi:protein ImuA